jgi:hypothetical protein
MVSIPGKDNTSTTPLVHKKQGILNAKGEE